MRNRNHSKLTKKDIDHACNCQDGRYFMPKLSNIWNHLRRCRYWYNTLIFKEGSKKIYIITLIETELFSTRTVSIDIDTDAGGEINLSYFLRLTLWSIYLWNIHDCVNALQATYIWIVSVLSKFQTRAHSKTNPICRPSFVLLILTTEHVHVNRWR